jgi:hypothetical protein
MREHIEITLWNNEGEIVVHDYVEAQLCTEEQINDAVFMIERGTPAYLAMMLALQPQPDQRNEA